MKKLLALLFCFIVTIAYAQSVPILMFHHVTSDGREAAHEVVKAEMFEEYLKMIVTEGYTTVTVSELADMIKKNRVKPKTVALTFDDGWRSNLEVIALLDKYKLKATLYIISGVFGSSGVPGDLQYISKEELIALSKKNNIEIGAHTHTHLMKWGPTEEKLDTMENAVIIGEMMQSKGIIESIIGKRVYSFAWPFGYIRPAARDIAPYMGFTSIVETNRISKNSAEISLFKLQRINIAGTCSPAQVKSMIETGNLDPCK